MDVVYPCREGDNEELRYSLRSLANVEHDEVWVFGGCPSWYQGRFVAVSQHEDKYGNARRAIEAACNDDRVSDPFALMNDDFYALSPVNIVLLNRGSLREMIAKQQAVRPSGVYLRNMRATLALLNSMGFKDPLSFGLHVPVPVHKSVMLRALEATRPGLHLRTVYGNLLGEPSPTIEDVKLCRMRNLAPDTGWMSTSDSTFPGARKMLGKAFPTPSAYESKMEVVVVKRFRDLRAGVSRREGDVFCVTADRLDEINANGIKVELVNEPKRREQSEGVA